MRHGMGRRFWLAVMAGLLLLIAASRMLAWADREMDMDEVWSVWQTFGSPLHIIAWTPYDWTPAYYLILGAWRALVGFTPFALRMSTLLIFLIGAAAAYQVGRRMGGARSAGALTALCYAALGFIVFASGYVRGRGFVVGLLPLAYWAMLAYFDRPTLKRGIALGVGLASLFYFYLTSPIAFIWMGVHTLIAHPRRLRRWGLPGAVAALMALPELIDKLPIIVERTEATMRTALPPLPEALIDLYGDFLGAGAPVWTLLIGLSAAAALRLRFEQRRPALSALFGALAAPILLYLANPILGFFNVNYAWWIAFGIALWLGVTLPRLPRPMVALSAAAALALMFVRVDNSLYAIPGAAVGANFRWLRDRFMPGDVMVVDPNCRCPPAEVWDYYSRVYFPNGLPVVDADTSARRVWYTSTDGEQDAETYAQIAAGRRAGAFFGKWDFLTRLYQQPPDPRGVLYENGMRFHGMDVIAAESPDDLLLEAGWIARREGETLRLHLWWSADAPPDRDYSVGVHLLDADGRLIAQTDGAPQPDDLPIPPSQWESGVIYRELRRLKLPFPLTSGVYRLMLVVYDWRDGRRIAAPQTDADGMLFLREITVKSW
jgi:hypothetical protein